MASIVAIASEIVPVKKKTIDYAKKLLRTGEGKGAR